MTRFGPLLLIFLSAWLAGDAVRMDAAARAQAVLRPRNTTLGRAAAVLPLLAAVPAAGAFEVQPPRSSGTPSQPDGKPPSVVAPDAEQTGPPPASDDWVSKAFEEPGPLPWTGPQPDLQPPSIGTLENMGQQEAELVSDDVAPEAFDWRAETVPWHAMAGNVGDAEAATAPAFIVPPADMPSGAPVDMPADQPPNLLQGLVDVMKEPVAKVVDVMKEPMAKAYDSWAHDAFTPLHGFMNTGPFSKKDAFGRQKTIQGKIYDAWSKEAFMPLHGFMNTGPFAPKDEFGNRPRSFEDKYMEEYLRSSSDYDGMYEYTPDAASFPTEREFMHDYERREVAPSAEDVGRWPSTLKEFLGEDASAGQEAQPGAAGASSAAPHMGFADHLGQRGASSVGGGGGPHMGHADRLGQHEAGRANGPAPDAGRAELLGRQGAGTAAGGEAPRVKRTFHLSQRETGRVAGPAPHMGYAPPAAAGDFGAPRDAAAPEEGLAGERPGEGA